MDDESDKAPEKSEKVDKVKSEKGENEKEKKPSNKEKAAEKVKSDNSENEDEESEKEESEDKEVPLLDQPLEKSGKRERKGVQRFEEPVEAKEVFMHIYFHYFYSGAIESLHFSVVHQLGLTPFNLHCNF